MAGDDNLRIGDAERDEAVTLLREHMSAGRITPGEFDERMSAALTAKTRGELAILFKDLPGDWPDGHMYSAPMPPAPAQPTASRFLPATQLPWLRPFILITVILACLAFLRFGGVMLLSVALLAFLLSKASGSQSQQLAQQPPRPIQPVERDELVALIRQGQKIIAIKRYREMTGADLRSAKYVIDALHDELGR